MKTTFQSILLPLSVWIASLSLPGMASDPQAADAGTMNQATVERVNSRKPAYSPYVNRNFPTRPFFGDTHLHAGLSMDAGAFGCRLTPRDAYRFARGDQVTTSSGQPAKLSRALDFLVVADTSSDSFGALTDKRNVKGIL